MEDWRLIDVLNKKQMQDFAKGHLMVWCEGKAAMEAFAEQCEEYGLIPYVPMTKLERVHFMTQGGKNVFWGSSSFESFSKNLNFTPKYEVTFGISEEDTFWSEVMKFA